jgi:deoxyribonuclease V
MDGTEQICVVQRMRDNLRPLFVSIGHKVDIPRAVALAMSSPKGRFRIPEPTPQADIEVGRMKNSGF